MNEDAIKEHVDEILTLTSMLPVGDLLVVRAPAAVSAALGEEVPPSSSAAEDPTATVLRLRAPVDLVGPVTVLAPPPSNEPVCEVRFVPPLELTVKLGAAYPASEAPELVLGASWLDVEALSQCVSELDSIAADSIGMPVLFTLLDWVKYSLWDHLGLGDQVAMLPEEAVEGGADPRVYSAAAEARTEEKQLINFLRENEAQEAEAFDAETHTCGVCFDDKLGQAFVRLAECKHAFCRDCTAGHCKSLVEEGAIAKLKCIEPGCGVDMPPHVLKSVLDETEFARWEKLSLAQSLATMDDVVYCPRQECSAPVIEESGHLGFCHACEFYFCTLCYGPWHQGTACMSPEDRLRVLEARSKGNARATADRERDLVGQMMSLSTIARSTKRCPSCKEAIVKTDHSCSKVVCRCGVTFCWRCGKQITGYEHYRDGKCQLFDADTLVDWNRRMRAQAAPEAAYRNEVMMMLQPQRPVRQCPQCGQRTVQDASNSNHIKCWRCNAHWCFSCLQIVRSTKEHYRPFGPGCRQHGAPQVA